MPVKVMIDCSYDENGEPKYAQKLAINNLEVHNDMCDIIVTAGQRLILGTTDIDNISDNNEEYEIGNITIIPEEDNEINSDDNNINNNSSSSSEGQSMNKKHDCKRKHSRKKVMITNDGHNNQEMNGFKRGSMSIQFKDTSNIIDEQSGESGDS